MTIEIKVKDLIEHLDDENFDISELTFLDNCPEKVALKYMGTEVYSDLIDYQLFEKEEYIDDIVKSFNACNNQEIKNFALFHIASIKGGFKIIKKLIKTNKLNFNIPNIAGKTPIYYAVLNKHKNNIKTLIKLGADVTVKDTNSSNLATTSIFTYDKKFIKWFYKIAPNAFDFEDKKVDLICILSAEEGMIDLIKYFKLNGGIDFNSYVGTYGSAIDCSMLFYNIDTALWLIENGVTTFNFNSSFYYPQDLFVPLTTRLNTLKQLNRGDNVNFENVIKEERIRAFLKRI
ncbi:MAG: ankyrin repeat domain-containing protein [Alphaproteobacteria bacterium]|nr:ankyrin repeat domain-containing protein [Alphaproteobacteria bacterium]